MFEGIIEEKIREVEEFIKRGYSEKKFCVRFGKDWELIVEIVRVRIRVKDKFLRSDFWMDMEGLCYVIYEVVVKYCVERLKEFGVESIVDVFCGIGI